MYTPRPTTKPLVLRAALLLVLAATTAGCGGTPHPPASPPSSLPVITGKVTYKGAPVTGGWINFYPGVKEGTKFMAPIDPKGNYTISDVPLKAMHVSIDTEATKGLMPGGDVPLKPPYAKDLVYVPIPKKYADPDTSGLTYTVKPGQQTWDIELKD